MDYTQLDIESFALLKGCLVKDNATGNYALRAEISDDTGSNYSKALTSRNHQMTLSDIVKKVVGVDANGNPTIRLAITDTAA